MTDAADTWRMYVPKAYMAPDPASLIATYPFGQIVTTHDDMPYATSVPMYLQEAPSGQTQLIGHMARHNPHASTLTSGQKALATFHGPNAYVSAGWYKDQPSVPTWNYIAAQVRGTLEPVDDFEEQLKIMRATIAKSEALYASSWLLDHAPDGKVDSLMPHIRSFRIAVTRLDGVTKLSQKNPPADQNRVIEALERQGGIQELEIARQMRALRDVSDPSGVT